MHRLKIAAVVSGLLLATLGTAVVVSEYSSKDAPLCTLQLQSGLVLWVRDQNGNAIRGAEVNAGPLTGSFWEFDGGYSGLPERSGTFRVTVAKDGYLPHTEKVTIRKDACHVITEERDIVLKAK